MKTCAYVYLDGKIQLARDARVPLFDRGLLFAHSVYEVTSVVGGRLVDSCAHLDRLARSLAGIDLPLPLSLPEIEAMETALCRQNALDEGVVYLQVTAGDYGERDFAGPAHLRPRLFAFCESRKLVDDRARDGIGAATLPDTRWARRDLKTTQLLSQALAYRRAGERGAQTAIMHEDGMVTEAASANVWIVDTRGVVRTRDLSPAILGGVTRAAVLELGAIDALESAFRVEDMMAASEVFLTSSGGMVLPVIEIDGQDIGPGTPGPVTRAVQSAYWERIGLVP
ncbi:MAG: aminotransferase class IV [Pseudomonadota bacterium]